MVESTLRAEHFELQAPASPLYLWEVAQKPVSAKIPHALVDRLEHEAVESFRSLSSRGSEIGGVLLGSVSPGNPAVVSIEDYELITCDYSRGPLYRLSDADMDRFARAIGRHTAEGVAVVGFFRSHTRKALALDAEDVTLFDTQFPASHHIALLIRPFATKASVAGIFIRENGAIRTEASYREFPFRSAQLAGSGRGPETSEPSPPVSGLGTALPPPAVPKTVARAQIVPIASRREITPAVPPLAPEPIQPANPPGPEATGPVAATLATKPAAATPVQEPAAQKPVPAPVAQKPGPGPAATAPAVEPAATPVVKPAAPTPTPKPAAAAPAAEPADPATLAKPAAKVAATPVESKPAAAKPAPAEPEPEKARGGTLLWVLVGSALALILLVGYLLIPKHHVPKVAVTSPQDSSALALRVQRTGGELLVTWNRDSDVIRTATHAVLSIGDGDQHENVELDVAALRTSSFVYTPGSADVVFKMEVSGQGQTKTTSESVRILQTRPSPMPEPGAKPNTAAAPAGDGSAAPDGTQPANPDTAAKGPERPLRPFRAESLSQRLRPAANTDLPDAPGLGSVQSPGTAAISSLNLNPAAPPPPPPPTQANAAPANPTAPVGAAQKAAPKTGGQIVPAELIHKKDPDYPKIARDAGAKGTVELLATIGVDGRVKSVKVIKGHPMLVKAAQDAVMQWLYKPTMLNGSAVEGQVNVQVNFLGR